MKNDFLAQNQKKRGELRGIIVVSIVLAIAVNILVFGICELVSTGKMSNWFFIGIGTLVIFIIAIGSLIIQKKNAKQIVCLKGMLVFDEKNEIVAIPQYGISESMRNDSLAAFTEKKALANQWYKSSNIGVVGESAKKKLVIELIQYCILDRLSTCLTDYFNSKEQKNLQLKKYKVNDIPDVLLSNHFLKLFTEPMEDREAFSSNQPSRKGISAIEDDGTHGTVVLAVGKDGAKYELFDLTLPEKTKIAMPNKNTIRLEMKYINLEFSVDFRGYSTVVGNDFYKYYLNMDPAQLIESYLFMVTFTTEIKHPILIGKKQAFYYDWIDLFLGKMDEYISTNSFYERIGWKQLQAQIRIIKNGMQKREEKL